MRFFPAGTLHPPSFSVDPLRIQRIVTKIPTPSILHKSIPLSTNMKEMKVKNVPGGQHVGDIKDRGVVTGPVVGGTNTEVRVLDGHRPSCKRNHLSAVLDVVVMEDGLLQCLFIYTCEMLQEREHWGWLAFG